MFETKDVLWCRDGHPERIPVLASAGNEDTPSMMGQLEARLIPAANGCTVELRGEVIRETQLVVHSVEAIVANDVHVVLDLTGITGVDVRGLEAVLNLMDVVRSRDGRLVFSGEKWMETGESFDAENTESFARGVTTLACESAQSRRI
jgi:hypothetical protein